MILLPIVVKGQALDTASELRHMIDDIKAFKHLGYEYILDARFPNGDKDHIKGETFADFDKGFLYTNCDAYTMLFTDHWFYNADHRKKVVTVVKIDKGNSKKAKIATASDFLQGTALTNFLDSIVIKTAIVKKIKREGDVLTLMLGFPKGKQVRELDLVFDTKNNILVSYNMTVFQPMQKTAKGIEGVEATIKCSNFKMSVDANVYDEQSYFSYNKGKIDLKKYNSYKLSTKM